MVVNSWFVTIRQDSLSEDAFFTKGPARGERRGES
jgi:hypothetical protein